MTDSQTEILWYHVAMKTAREIELQTQLDKALLDYEVSKAEYQKEWDACHAEVSRLFGGEIPEFISYDYIEGWMYEKSPKELVDEIIVFFASLKNDA